MHPFLKQVLSEPYNIEAIVKKSPETIDEPILEAIKLISENSRSTRHRDNKPVELVKALEFDVSRSSCSEFAIMYLMQIHGLYPNRRKLKKENIYLSQAVELVSTKTNPSIEALLYSVCAANSEAYYNSNQVRQLFKKAKNCNPLKYYLDYYQIIRFYLLYHAFNGGLIKKKQEPLQLIKAIEKSDIAKNQKEELVDYVNSSVFIDSVCRGDTVKSEVDLKKIKNYTAQVQRFITYYYLQKGVLNPYQWVEVGLYKEEKSIPLWVEVDLELLKQKPKSALKLSKKLVANNTGVLTRPYLYLIKSELANKNTHAAEWLINKHEVTPDNWEDFLAFKCRLELLKNNRKKALEYFIKLYKQSEYFEKVGILDHNLDLAPEISSEDLSFLKQKARESKYKFKITDSQVITGSQNIFKDSIIGISKATKLIKKLIKKYADLSTPVLISGETGVGKELVANELHKQSKRANQPYLTINCSAIPDSLLQSELFGHEKGAYTSANKAHKGLFEAAGKGSVFLDEFGDISPLLQVSLLRVMEKMEVRPIGSSYTRKIYCRFIIATNVNLKKMVSKKQFRKDLYYRIKQFEINILPLRERKEDILYIANFYLNQGRLKGKATISLDLEQKLLNHYWEGNVRELKNEIEKARLLNSDMKYYTAKDILEDIKKTVPANNEVTSITKNEAPVEESETEEKIFERDLMRAKVIKSRKKSSNLRRARILNLFNNFDALYRQEVAEILEVSPRTISSDFKQLIDEGLIIRVEPTSSPRSYYFVLN